MKEPAPWTGCRLQSGGGIRDAKGTRLRGKEDVLRGQVARAEETGSPGEEGTMTCDLCRPSGPAAGVQGGLLPGPPESSHVITQDPQLPTHSTYLCSLHPFPPKSTCGSHPSPPPLEDV